MKKVKTDTDNNHLQWAPQQIIVTMYTAISAFDFEIVTVRLPEPTASYLLYRSFTL